MLLDQLQVKTTLKEILMHQSKLLNIQTSSAHSVKRFHDTMNEVMDKYGESGEVAWVFRQFPLEQLHPVKAQAVAVASECANEQGGNDAFWQFTDGYFDVTLTNNRTDIETVIPQLAKKLD